MPSAAAVAVGRNVVFFTKRGLVVQNQVRVTKGHEEQRVEAREHLYKHLVANIPYQLGLRGFGRLGRRAIGVLVVDVPACAKRNLRN